MQAFRTKVELDNIFKPSHWNVHIHKDALKLA